MARPQVLLVASAAVLLVALVGVGLWVAGSQAQRLLSLRSVADRGLPARGALLDGVDRRLRRSRAGRRLVRRLAAAGVETAPVTFVAVVAGLAAGIFVISRSFLPPVLAAASGGASVWACFSWLRRRQGQRGELFVSQLPEVARVLSNSAAAGLAIRTAVEMAAREVEEPASTELTLTAQSLRLGRSLEQALHDLEERLPSREVGILVTTLVIQQRSGGGLVTALRNMAQTLEARKDLRREVRTIMAGPVVMSYLVPLLGAGMLLLLNAISPGLLDSLASAGVGRVALLVSGGLFVIGFAMIRRLTRIAT